MNLMELFKLFDDICKFENISFKFFDLFSDITNIKKDGNILLNEKIIKYKEIIDTAEEKFLIIKDIEKNSYIFNNKLSLYDISLTEKEYYGILYLLVCENVIINEIDLQSDNPDEILKKCKNEVLYINTNRISLMYNDNNFNPYYLENRDIYEEEFKQVEYVTKLLYDYVINNQNLYDPEIIKTIFMYKYKITTDINNNKLAYFSINEYFFRRKPDDIFILTIDDVKEIIDERIFNLFESLRIKMSPKPYHGDIFRNYFIYISNNKKFNEKLNNEFIRITANIFLNNNFDLLNDTNITKKTLIDFINLRSYIFKKLYKILNRNDLWYFLNDILSNNITQSVVLNEWALAIAKFLVKRRINKNLNIDFINDDVLTDMLTESLN